MLRRVLTVAATAAVLGVSGCGGDDQEPATSPEATTAEQEAVTVELSEQSDSGQSGQATLTPQEGQTRVAIELDNPPSVPQPVHIHEGTCDDLNPAPEYPLENLTDGTSETVVDVPLADLQEGEFAINAHASPDDLETYVACGDIPSDGA